jgi:hypothetical protein
MLGSNVFLWAIAAGILMYAILELDKRYFSEGESSVQYSSLRIASLVSLIVWVICAYIQNDIIEKVPALRVENQKILTDPF